MSNFFSDLFFGARPDYALPGYVSDLQNQIAATIPQQGTFFKRQYKNIANTYNRDPEELATQALNQGAVERRGIQEDYMTGANALIGQYGNEGQQNLQQRMKEMAINRVNERQGIAAQNEAQSKYFNALAGGQAATNAEEATTTARLGLMAGLMGNQYDRTRRGGIFNPQTISGAIQGFAQGAGAGLGASIGHCWIAEALFGEDDPRTHLLRHWISKVWAKQSIAGALFDLAYLVFGRFIEAKIRQGNKLTTKIAFRVFQNLLARAHQ